MQFRDTIFVHVIFEHRSKGYLTCGLHVNFSRATCDHHSFCAEMRKTAGRLTARAFPLVRRPVFHFCPLLSIWTCPFGQFLSTLFTPSTCINRGVDKNTFCWCPYIYILLPALLLYLGHKDNKNKNKRKIKRNGQGWKRG